MGNITLSERYKRLIGDGEGILSDNSTWRVWFVGFAFLVDEDRVPECPAIALFGWLATACALCIAAKDGAK